MCCRGLFIFYEINNFYKELLSRKKYLDNKIKNNPSIKSDYDNILNEINEDTMCFEHLIKREEPILFIKDKDNFYDSGSVRVANAKIRCWKTGGHGHQTFLQVVENSCNLGVNTGTYLNLEKNLQII